MPRRTKKKKTRMNDQGVDPNEIVARFPRLYHMAERDSLPSILEHGLLSTSSLLDLYGLTGKDRREIESELRAKSIPIDAAGLGRAVVRDQCPMSDLTLRECLRGGLKPKDWLHLLNARVFFWVSQERLHGLLNARNYAKDEHDVLILDTRTVIEDYKDKIDLCPINSGATIPWKHPRDSKSFLPINQYPWADWIKKRGKKGQTVVELTVKGGVKDVERHLVEAWRMKGTKRQRKLA